MTKKLLPAMIGVALVSGAAVAQADVTVFGHLDTSVVGWDDNDGWAFGRVFASDSDPANPDYDGDDINFRCTTCSLGFKGSEDLGNGLKAVFMLDFQFDMFNVSSGDSITDRDQYAGLAGNFGQVVVGTMSTTYKSHGAMLDPGYRTVAQMRDVGIQSFLHSGSGEAGQGRATNSVRWDSPDWNGLQVMATYTLDSDETADDAGNAADEQDDPYSAGVQYTNGGLLVFADYITDDNGDNDEAYKVGGKFSMNNFSVFGQYEVDDGLISQRNGQALDAGPAFTKLNGDNTDGADIWMVGGSYSMGNNTIYAAYANASDADDDGLDANTEWDAWEIVGIHSLSKRTLAYAGYISMEPDDNDAVGDDASAWALGLKHKF